MGVRLAIGLIISGGYVPPRVFWRSLLAIERQVRSGASNRTLPPHLHITGLQIIESRQFPTDVARNDVCAGVLEGLNDYLLFLDADMVHPANIVENLLVHEKPVITARCHVKEYPYHAAMFVKDRVRDDEQAYTSVSYGRGVFEVERSGAAALLIRRDVLERLFELHGHNWFRYQRHPDPPHDYIVSEDAWFWKIAREAGFSTWANWDVVSGHVHETVIGDSFFQMALDHQRTQAMEQGGEIWERWKAHAVVCGYPEGVTLPNGDLVPPYSTTPAGRKGAR